jgi:MFS family permease
LPDQAVATAPAVRDRRRVALFWSVAYAYLVIMLGTTLPSPLYGLYQERFAFDAGMLTLIFAAYAGGVLVALLLFGGLSDRVGRRPVVTAALLVAALSGALFVLADDVVVLLAGRVVSGLAAGLVTGVAAAALTELEPHGRTQRASVVSTTVSTFGLGLGPLIAGLLAGYGPWPVRLPFAVYLRLLLPALFLVRWMPGTAARQPGGTGRWHLRRPAVARAVRPAFTVGSMAAFAAFAVLGFFTSFAPTFMSGALGIGAPAVSGLIVFAVFAASGSAQLLFRRLRDRSAITSGVAIIPVGLLLIVLALDTDSLPLFIAGALAGGAGSGLAFMGSLMLINRLAPVADRAGTVSAFFVVCYLAISLPVIGLGFATQAFGRYPAALAFAVLIGGLALIVGTIKIAVGRPKQNQSRRSAARPDTGGRTRPRGLSSRSTTAAHAADTVRPH